MISKAKFGWQLSENREDDLEQVARDLSNTNFYLEVV